jgi:hypothetical protein
VAQLPDRFDPALVAEMEEPVRRYFAHAIEASAPLAPHVRLRMTGRIKVGRWLAFTAEQDVDGRSFMWRAAAGLGRFKPLHVVDSYADGRGAMEGRLAGRVRLFRAADQDTTRSAAGRTALESIAFAPTAVLPQRGVVWSAEGRNILNARFDLPPEQPAVRIWIDEDGAIRRFGAQRWGNAGRGPYDYIPCGAEVHEERRFEGVAIPSRFTVGWWFDTPRWAPFFEARIVHAALVT